MGDATAAATATAATARAARAAASLPDELKALGREARDAVGASDVATMRALKWSSRLAEVTGRALLWLAPGPAGFVAGTAALAYHLSVEAQLNHTVMHGAFVGIPGAERFQPGTYETLALPLRSRTWGDAHRIHHAWPSVPGRDPDTVHPLFRVHPSQPWRWWHLGNTFLGALLVFECWALDYDRFLKKARVRDPRDRGELRKLALFGAYQYVLWPLLAGPRWGTVLAGTVLAVLVRNVVFVALQTASSVGERVSTAHAEAPPRAGPAWWRFQIETSKDFRAPRFWTVLCGGLDRHIEHHLWPWLPPHRLRALAPRVRELCLRYGIRHEEHLSWWASLRDSFGWLRRLSLR